MMSEHFQGSWEPWESCLAEPSCLIWGFEIRWLHNVVERSLCCLLLDLNPGPSETIVCVVFIFECVLYGSRRFASLKAKRLAIKGGFQGFISLHDDVQLLGIALWHLFWCKAVCVYAHVCVCARKACVPSDLAPCISFTAQSSPVGQPAPNDIITLVYCSPRGSAMLMGLASHYLILVQHFCKIRNLEKHLFSIKWF